MLGTSAILHAETGSGKTLTYLLPLLKRLHGADGTLDMSPLQALIIVPTKELAVQIAADIVALTNDKTAMDLKHLCTDIVDLCITTKRGGISSFTAPIVIGTPFKILDTMNAASSHAASLNTVKYLVLDEVDRLLSVVGKYATTEQIRGQKQEPSPCATVIDRITDGRTPESLQIIAASATIGRPMRRELFRILQGDYADWTQDSMPVLRKKEASSRDETTSRAVSIPASITHSIKLCDESSDSNEGKARNQKLAQAKEIFVKRVAKGAKRGLLFVPSQDDVKDVVGILLFWGVDAKSIQKELGLATQKAVSSKRNNKSNKNNNNKKENNEWHKTASDMHTNKCIDELIRRAALNRIGASSQILEGCPDGTSEDPDASAELFVTSFAGTRGLHVSDIDVVFILQVPRTMDEYLHMAGRTGRVGKDGSVVTVATIEEMKRLQSWQTPLGLTLNVEL